MNTPKVYKAHWLPYEGIYFTCGEDLPYSRELDEVEFVKLSDHKKLIKDHAAEELSQMNEQGILPFKQEGRWTVTYLSEHAEGVCEACFDSIFDAMKFSRVLLK